MSSNPAQATCQLFTVNMVCPSTTITYNNQTFTVNNATVFVFDPCVSIAAAGSNPANPNSICYNIDCANCPPPPGVAPGTTGGRCQYCFQINNPNATQSNPLAMIYNGPTNLTQMPCVPANNSFIQNLNANAIYNILAFDPSQVLFDPDLSTCA